MGGWGFNRMGPQRGPATVGRLRAKWRQTEVENREAIVIRRQWMELMGCDAEEIDEICNKSFDLNLEEELEQLSAAVRLSKIKK